MRRVAAGISVVVAVLLLAGLAGGGWYYSDQLLPAPREWQPPLEVAVVDSDEQAGTLVLDAVEGDLVDLGHVGFITDGGVVLLEGPAAPGPEGVQRTGTLLTGEWPAAGELGGVSIDGYRGDPALTLGLPFDEVDIDGSLGVLPAWRVVPVGAPTDETWVVIVHGRSGSKSEGNRVLETVAELGLPALSIAVRNDDDAAPDPEGFGRYGAAEWEDLAAALEHLRRVEDARRFVLVGYSQGGSMVLTYLRRADDTRDVAAGVLISPLISFGDTLVLQAQNRDVPDPLIGPLLFATQLYSRVRADFDHGEVEHLEALDELPSRIPLLVTAGEADRTIPVGPARELAAARPDQVTYEEYPDADHVREWNVDRQRFEADLRAFLERTVPDLAR
jgi:uncharacterized protein